MQKRFVSGLMRKKLNHLVIMTQSLKFKQVSKSLNLNDFTLFFFIFIDHGTSHCSVIDAEGNAVAVTGTINTE